MTPAGFLELLWRGKPDPLNIFIWLLQGKRSQWFQDIRSAGEFVQSQLGRDVYVGVGLSQSNHGEMNRCISGEIAGLAGMWADLDLKSEAHDGKALPSIISDAIAILPSSMTPSILISTGNGVHVWWLFKEPYIFESDEERKGVAGLVRRWHTMLRLRSAAHGWAYDCLSDMARLLRIPNTKNHKDPANPKEVTVLSQTAHRYNLLDFEEFLDAAGIPDQEAEEKGVRAWAEQFADTPLAINGDARISQEMLWVLWGVAPDRVFLGGRRWLPRWRFQPSESLIDAFRLLEASDPDEYSMGATGHGSFCVRVRLRNGCGEAQDHCKPRAITYALARALGLEVDR